MDTKSISCCFDQGSQRMLESYREKGLGHTSVAIAKAVVGYGLTGSTVLELGCGFGALMLELVGKGASRATGVDLSPKMIEAANLLAAEKGLSESVAFKLGDGAVAALPKADIVILDSVVCCYPDTKTLLENSSSAAAHVYAISVPDDSRVATKTLRLLLPLQRVIFRRSGFKFFIHPTDEIQRTLKEKGLTLASKSHVGWVWSVFVFRTGS